MWNILGQIIRPFGLTADETSLSIRIPEIERENKKGARVFLTNSPTKTLDFLGLSHQNGEWTRPFKSVEDLFEYAASCKWFMLWPEGSEAAEKEATLDNGTTAQGQSGYLSKLKHNDRARMKQRPLFARWVEDFRPRCHEQGRSLVADPGRTPGHVHDEVRLQAFRAFPASEHAYAAALAAWRREKVRIYVKTKVIKEDMCLPADVSRVLPAPQERADTSAADTSAADIERNWRGVLRSALAKILIEDDAGFDGIEPPRLRDEEGTLVVEDVKDWVNRNWEEVGRVAWQSQCAKVRAKMEEKRKLAEVSAAAEGEITDNGDNNI